MIAFRDRSTRLVLAALTIAGCQQSPEKLPFREDRCGSDFCSEPRLHPAVRGSSPGNPSVTPDAGAADASVAGEVFGEVVLAISPDLSRVTRDLTNAVSVFGPDAGAGAQTEVSPGEVFRLPLSGPPPWWLRVAPNAQSPELLGTLQAVQGPGEVQLFVIERQTLSDVSESLTQNPVALDPARAQAIVHFVDPAGAALSGVSVEPQSGILAYDIGDTYTDATTVTATRGAVVLFNITAANAPGRETTLQALYRSTVYSLRFPVVTDTLTSAVFMLDES